MGYRNDLTQADLERWDRVRAEFLAALEAGRNGGGTAQHNGNGHAPVDGRRCGVCGSARVVPSLLVRCQGCARVVCPACRIGRKRFCRACAEAVKAAAAADRSLEELFALDDGGG